MNCSNNEIFGIILAAGESKRMGTPKQLLTYNNTSFIMHVIYGMLHAGIKNIIIVCGYIFDKIKEHIEYHCNLIIPSQFTANIYIVQNENYHLGQFSSLKTGLQYFLNKNKIDFYKGFMLQLVDRPLVKYETYQKLKNEFMNNNHLILIPSYNMKRGHPVCFSTNLINEIINLNVDDSLKTIIQKYENSISHLVVDDIGIIINIDTPIDYEKIKK